MDGGAAAVAAPQARGRGGEPNPAPPLRYVDEEESVRRQLSRGSQLLVENQMVKDTGIGRVHKPRDTDLEEPAARRRYRVFKGEGALSAPSSIKCTPLVP